MLNIYYLHLPTPSSSLSLHLQPVATQIMCRLFIAANAYFPTSKAIAEIGEKVCTLVLSLSVCLFVCVCVRPGCWWVETICTLLSLHCNHKPVVVFNVVVFAILRWHSAKKTIYAPFFCCCYCFRLSFITWAINLRSMGKFRWNAYSTFHRLKNGFLHSLRCIRWFCRIPMEMV